MKLGVFIDVNNLMHGCRYKLGGNVDLIKVHEEVLKFGKVIQGFAYGHANNNKGIPHLLTKLGYHPKWLPNYNVNVTLAMDLARLLELVGTDGGLERTLEGIVFVSNDLNLIPCIEYANECGLNAYSIGFRLQKLTKRLSTKVLELGKDHLRVNDDNRTDTPAEQLVVPSSGLLASP